MSPQDEIFLRRTIRLAMNGRGRVEPNPMVGCLLVKDGRVIGEGWHTHFGGPHAEPTALADCTARGESPAGATAYVTLEPCCHLNKKTPPCAPRLIKEGIARVVIGCLDPNPDVNGKGVLMLEKHGVIVDAAPPEIAVDFLQLIAPFRAKTFYTTVKWAESADRYVAGLGGRPVQITSELANHAVHRLRTRCDGIAVGINTVLTDDPALTVRDVSVLRKPTRFILDRSLRIPLTAKMLTVAGRSQTGQDVYILTDSQAKTENADKANAIWNAGGDVIAVKNYYNDPEAFRNAPVFESRVNTHLLIETGPTLAASVLPWADRLWIFQSTEKIGIGTCAPARSLFEDRYVETGRVMLGPDLLIEYLNTAAPTFMAATPSADLVLEQEGASSFHADTR